MKIYRHGYRVFNYNNYYYLIYDVECTNVTSEIETGQLLRSLKDKVKTKSQKEKNVQKLKDQIQSQNVTNYKV